VGIFVEDEPLERQFLVVEPEDPLLFDIVPDEGKGKYVLLDLSVGVDDRELLLDRAASLLLQLGQLVHGLEMFGVEDVEIFVLED
jgi:hypothetical protein